MNEQLGEEEAGKAGPSCHTEQEEDDDDTSESGDTSSSHSMIPYHSPFESSQDLMAGNYYVIDLCTVGKLLSPSTIFIQPTILIQPTAISPIHHSYHGIVKVSQDETRTIIVCKTNDR